MRVSLNQYEMEALLAAAGNVDPDMFLQDVGGKEGERLYDAWQSGMDKLRAALAKV